MGRYQIAIKQQDQVKPTAYRFKESNSIYKICGYIKKCINDRVSFDASNIPLAILDPAIVKIGNELGIPIVTESESTASVLAITHNNKKIFSMNNLPETYDRIICYWDVKTKPKNAYVVLTVIRK